MKRWSETETNAKRGLEWGDDVPLKWGYIGLKGRSQQDLQNGVTVAKGLKTEKEHFECHPVFSHLPSGLVGTEALLQKFYKVLFFPYKKNST